jgi:hypothetical protein
MEVGSRLRPFFLGKQARDLSIRLVDVIPDVLCLQLVPLIGSAVLEQDLSAVDAVAQQSGDRE